MLSKDDLPIIPDNQTCRVRSSNTASENEILTIRQAASHTPSLQASTIKSNNTQSVDGIACSRSPAIKAHRHGRDKPDDGNTMMLGVFLDESMSGDSVGTELSVHGIDVRDDKNTTTVKRAATTNQSLKTRKKGSIHSPSSCSFSSHGYSGNNVDGIQDQHTQKDVSSFDEKKISKQSESNIVSADQESSSFCIVSSQFASSLSALKKMLHYSTITIFGKHDNDNVGGARFTENEAERINKSKSCEDDALDAMHEGISDAKKVRFAAAEDFLDSNVTVTSICDSKNKVTNPKSRINRISNEQTDAPLPQKEKEKHYALVVEEVSPYSI